LANPNRYSSGYGNKFVPPNKSAVKLPKTKPVIAIVDDEQSVLRGLSRLLGTNDFKVELFNCGGAFLERATNDVACVVLDIHMGGMSGFEIRRRLAARGSTIPVIFMTALDSAPVRREAVEAGCAAFLSKPFSRDELIGAIRKATSPP
jgi:FixJ family two-component response regulator